MRLSASLPGWQDTSASAACSTARSDQYPLGRRRRLRRRRRVGAVDKWAATSRTATGMAADAAGGLAGDSACAPSTNATVAPDTPAPAGEGSLISSCAATTARTATAAVVPAFSVRRRRLGEDRRGTAGCRSAATGDSATSSGGARGKVGNSPRGGRPTRLIDGCGDGGESGDDRIDTSSEMATGLAASAGSCRGRPPTERCCRVGKRMPGRGSGGCVTGTKQGARAGTSRHGA